MSNESRYYQIEADQAVFSALEKGIGTQMIVSATGTGKTTIGVGVAKKFERILWLTHNEDLILQSSIALLAEELQEDKKWLRDIIFAQGGLMKILSGNKKYEITKICNILGIVKEDLLVTDKRFTVASVQTIWRRLSQIPADTFDLIIVDECHHAGAPTWSKILDHFTPKLRLGLTATPWRSGDDMTLLDLFEEVVYEYPVIKGIQDGYLCKPDAIKVRTSANLDKVKTIGLDFNQKELSDKINTPERNILIVRKYQEYALGRPFIAFCAGVQHTIDLCETFNELGVKASYVVGDKDLTPERNAVINAFLSQNYIDNPGEGLINCLIATEGFDYEDLGCVIQACPTKSKTKFWQMIGRGLRRKTSQFVSKFSQNCIILDVVDNFSKPGLINTETEDKHLLLEDKIFILESDRKKLQDAKAKREQQLDVVLTNVDERIELLPLPRRILSKSPRMKEPALEHQIKQLRHWGYPVDSVEYTRFQFSEILLSQPCSKEEFDNVAACGFDVSNGVTVAEARDAITLINKMDKQKALQRK